MNSNSSCDVLLLVGLGNPGLEYSKTRHNIGYEVLDALAAKLGVVFNKNTRFCANVAIAEVGVTKIILIKPLTYMNLSGQSVGCVSRYYKITPENILVVVDDCALPFGHLRFRASGSSGGHNGLKSIEAHLGTNAYTRIKVGIGQPARQNLADFVLEAFNASEREVLPSLYDKVSDFLLDYIRASEIQLTHLIRLINSWKPQLPKSDL